MLPIFVGSLIVALAAVAAFIVAKRPRATKAALAPAPRAPSAPRPSAPKEPPAPRPSASRRAPADLGIANLIEDDDDDAPDITRIALVAGESPEITVSEIDPDLLGDLNEGEAAPRRSIGSAVPILHDEDAAADEPTRTRAWFLVSAAGQSDRGVRRRKNEDRHLELPEHAFFAVADGMGGHKGGEIASELAVRTLEAAFRSESFEGAPYPGVPRRGSELALAVQMANGAIFRRAQEERALEGMGTTLIGARFSPNKERVYVAHVGDSRCYRLRQGELTRMTTDHTLAAKGIRGPLSERLHRALGVAPAVSVDLVIARPRPGDVYLLCSDGLFKMLEDDEIRDLLLAETNLERAVERLVARANEKGGHDNVTVVLVGVRAP